MRDSLRFTIRKDGEFSDFGENCYGLWRNEYALNESEHEEYWEIIIIWLAEMVLGDDPIEPIEDSDSDNEYTYVDSDCNYDACGLD